MKKTIPLLVATAMFTLPFTTYAQTAEVTAVEAPAETTTQAPSREVLDKLTLEDVIERGVNNNKNLIVLQLNLEVTQNQLLDTKYDAAEVQWNIRDLDRRLDRLRKEREVLSGAMILANGSERMAMMDSLDTLKDQIQALELAIKKLQLGEMQIQLQSDEAKEGVRLLLTSTYANLTVLKQQIDFTKKAITSATTDVNRAQRLYDRGMGSKEAIRLAKVAEKNLQKQLEEQQKKYNQDVAKLSFDIGIGVNPDMKLQPIEHTPVAKERPTDFTTFINNSFKVKKAIKTLETTVTDRDDAYREYEEDDDVGPDVSKYELQQKDSQVKAAEETVRLTKDQVETALDQLYYNVDNTQFLFEEALRKAEDTKQDLRALQVRYRLGLISKYNYELAKLQLEQANLNVETAKIRHLLTNETLQAAEVGYIQ